MGHKCHFDESKGLKYAQRVKNTVRLAKTWQLHK